MIDNAIKYAPDGTRVTVSFEEREDVVTLGVESFGPLIRSDEMERIFDLFYRADAARAVNSEGTGFGLASAQNVAKEHNTEIRIEQTERRGPSGTFFTVFSVSFPIAEYERRESH